ALRVAQPLSRVVGGPPHPRSGCPGSPCSAILAGVTLARAPAIWPTGGGEAVRAQRTSGEPAPAVGREPGRRALGEGTACLEGLPLRAWTTTRFGPWSLDSPELIPLAAPSSSGPRSWPKALTSRRS